MASDLLQKLDDVIKLQLESKADIEALGRKAVWMADRVAKLEAALQKIVDGPEGKHDHEWGCPFEQFACSVARDALRKPE